MDVPSKNARRGCEPGARSAEGALRGVLSFGYFSLHKQRKVTRRQAKAVAVASSFRALTAKASATAKAFALAGELLFFARAKKR
ncbi:hypothetical protein [Xanthomonas sacchari]|uniref:hypothetical protein n=1 Tax=Xanthomonas sacchari TaxID=56458 RepID=UPI00225A6698|nr:hypothetical protein [Xanthomonas sacchari]